MMYCSNPWCSNPRDERGNKCYPCATDPFAAYLAQPCDKCDKRATHSQSGGKFCNEHTDWNKPARARND